MSTEISKIPLLSSKAIDLLERLDDCFKKFDEDESPDSFVQNVENYEYSNQITWVIKKTQLMETKPRNCLKSPNVEMHFQNTCKIWLEIFKNEQSSDGSSVDVIVCFNNLPEKVLVQCDIFCLNENKDITWEESFSGDMLKEKKINFRNFFIGVDRCNLSNQNFIIECRIKLFASVYQCNVFGQLQKKYSVTEIPNGNSYMKNIFNTGKYADVDLVVDSRNLKAHKCILASESPVFSILFKIVPQKKCQLKDKNYNVIRDLLSYVYTRNIEISDFLHAFELYVAASNYGIEILKNLCSAYINASLSELNICESFDLARKHNDEFLMKACLKFIKENDIVLTAKIFIGEHKEY